jgi:heat shock protein HtpX
MFFGGSNSDDEEGGGGGFLGVMLMMVVGPIAASIIQLAVSRSREFQADADGARITGDPLGLASALRKIHMGTSSLPLPADPRLEPVSHLMIDNPFRGSGLAKLFATHPPMEERVRRLEQMAGLGSR